MSELPYQQTLGELWDDVVATLTDFEFLKREATDAGVVESTDEEGSVVRSHTGIYQIRDDYTLELARMPGGEGPAGPGDKRTIIVTGVDLGNGLELRCPHCNTGVPFQEAWKGKEMPCPNCGGPLKVNPFTVQRPVWQR